MIINAWKAQKFVQIPNNKIESAYNESLKKWGMLKADHNNASGNGFLPINPALFNSEQLTPHMLAA